MKNDIPWKFELPDNAEPLALLVNIDGYLHIFSNQPNDILLTLLDMAAESVENERYDEKTTMLQ